MRPGRLLSAGFLLLLAISGPAAAQPFAPIQAGPHGGTFALTPLLGDGELFQSAGIAPTPDLRAQGTVGGRGMSSLGAIEIGFDYIRPYWTSRDFTLAVPAANAGSFPLLGDVGHVDDHFALAPRLNYKYDVSDVLAIKATGSFMNLTGHLERTLSAPDGTLANLSANSSLTIVTANLPEISTRFYYDELFLRPAQSHWSIFNDLAIDLGIGTRYSSIEQNYTGKLTNTVPAGKNETQRYSHQNFKGVGLTTTLNFSLPVRDEWRLFTNLRGSILVGDNSKDSSLSVVLQGVPGAATSISQSKTEFIPIGEMEVGAEWTHEFSDVARPTVPPALFTVRVGFSGQIWGNVGPLSAGSPQGFRTSNLYLVGAHVMVGLAR
ncbi:MAG: hypothetical protein HYR84_09635 [Planctomycetes bacterium]|nr:hypothetical protein [Planctomycetota bacterium]